MFVPLPGSVVTGSGAYEGGGSGPNHMPWGICGGICPRPYAMGERGKITSNYGDVGARSAQRFFLWEGGHSN